MTDGPARPDERHGHCFAPGPGNDHDRLSSEAAPSRASRFAIARRQAAATALEFSDLLASDEHYVRLLFMRMAVDPLEALPAVRGRD